MASSDTEERKESPKVSLARNMLDACVWNASNSGFFSQDSHPQLTHFSYGGDNL